MLKKIEFSFGIYIKIKITTKPDLYLMVDLPFLNFLNILNYKILGHGYNSRQPINKIQDISINSFKFMMNFIIKLQSHVKFIVNHYSLINKKYAMNIINMFHIDIRNTCMYNSKPL